MPEKKQYRSLKFQIEQAVTMGIEYVGERCRVLVHEDLLHDILWDEIMVPDTLSYASWVTL